MGCTKGVLGPLLACPPTSSLTWITQGVTQKGCECVPLRQMLTHTPRPLAIPRFEPRYGRASTAHTHDHLLCASQCTADVSIHPSTCAAKGGGGCITKTVRTATCADLIRTHGTPILLKIDRGRRPHVPLIAPGASGGRHSFADVRCHRRQWPLDLLVSLGYTGFKLVAGHTIRMITMARTRSYRILWAACRGNAQTLERHKPRSNADAVRSHKL